MGILRTDTISGLETPTPVTGSVVFDGTNDILSIGSVGNWNFLHNGLTDWTVEFWGKSGTATGQFVWGTAGSSAQRGFYLHIMSTTTQGDGQGVYAQLSSGSAGNYRSWGKNNCLSLDTWHHIAAVFKSSDKTLAIYVDGKEVDNGTGTVNGTPVYSSNDSTHPLLMGENPHANVDDLNGEISNLRVVAGRRLYTSEFTPPVHALEPINGTVVLCCNNPDSVTSSSNAGIGTAHIITTSGDPTVGTDYPGLTRDFTSGTQFQGVAKFDTQGYFVPPSGTTEQRFPNFAGAPASSARGLSVGGGIGPTFDENTIDYITISTLGNAIDFGDASNIHGYRTTALGNSTRAVFGGAYYNTLEYVTFSSTGNGTDFGDIINVRQNASSLANSTRGIFTGGNSTSTANIIEYITISTTGNAIQFGTLTTSSSRAHTATAASSTRGIFAGGGANPVSVNTIDYIAIPTTGNAINFGDLTKGTIGFSGGGGSNATRMIIAGINYSPGLEDFAQFITISTLGNAQDFGDLGSGDNGSRPNGSACSSTRAVFGGGYGAQTPGNATSNAMAYYTIATTGNAIDFGDTTTTRFNHYMCSNGHGGLG